jgi:protein-disulfide isomerase
MASEVEKLNSTNKFLVVGLIIAAFFLGSLTNKVASLEKAGSPVIAADAKLAQQGNAAPTPAAKKPKNVTAADHTKGNINAKITLIEYSDFECPFCKNFEPILKQVMDTYGDKVRLVYRQYPLPFHANAQKESEASECVANLGGNDAFWKFADAIYQRTTSNGTGFALDQLGPLAAEVGVDQTAFQSCLDSGKYEKLVKDSIAEGQGAGVSGTPSTFVNGTPIVGACPFATFESAIKAEQAGKKWFVDERCQFVNL